MPVPATHNLAEQAHLARVAILGRLSAALAHELNQPLNAILNNAQAAQRFLLRDPGDVAVIEEVLEDIVRNALRASELVSHLRSLMKKRESVRRVQDVNVLIREAAQLLRCALTGTQVSLSLNLADPLPSVSCDPVQLLQVALNLVTNGIEALAPQQTRRHIVVSTACSGAAHIEIAVADTGPGLDPAELESIFSPFHTSKPDGLGLGLSICRAIVEDHGGRLWATNNSGGGACFHVILPIVNKDTP